MAQKRKAVVLGATGLVGGELLRLLLDDDQYESVVAIGRRGLQESSPKLTQRIAPLEEMEQYSADFEAADVFVCLGTTAAKTPDRQVYFAIDHDYPVLAVTLAARYQARLAIVVSAMGSNPDSRIFYSATKGRMERAVLAAFPGKAYCVRPSLIMGERPEKRIWEGLAMGLFRWFNPLLPAKMRGIPARTIARAMISMAQTPPMVAIQENDQLLKLGKES
jgi:uncharacterized protein YbjT (DUF2867 family)